MNIIEISNLFNTITAHHSDLASYHFGWASDINRNVQNNFDPTQVIGTVFPLVQWVAPPEGEYDLTRLNESIDVRLHFYDLMYRDGNANTTTQTSLEHWKDLHYWAIQFLREVNRLGRALGPVNSGIEIRNSLVRWLADGHSHNDNLIWIGCTFTLDTKLFCDDLNIDTDDLDAGYIWPPSSSADIENTFS